MYGYYYEPVRNRMYFVLHSRCPICRLSGVRIVDLAGSRYWMDGMGRLPDRMCSCRCSVLCTGCIGCDCKSLSSGGAGTVFLSGTSNRYRNESKRNWESGLYRCSWMPGERNKTKQSIKRPIGYGKRIYAGKSGDDCDFIRRAGKNGGDFRSRMYETISGESRNQQGTSDPGTKIHHNQTESSIQQKIYGLSTWRDWNHYQ